MSDMNLNSIPIFFNLVKSCHDGSLLYPSGNPVVTQQYENFLTTYQNYLDSNGQLVILAQAGYIKINDQTLPGNVGRMGSVTWFLAQCLDRNLVRTVLHAKLRIKDVKGWVNLFHRKPMEFLNQDSAAQFLAEAGVQGIEVFHAPAPPLANQFFEPPSPTLDGFVGSDEAVIPSSEYADGFATRPDPEANRLFISDEDKKTLFRTISEYILEGNLKRVAEILTLIRDDLVVPSLEDRQIAFSSYQMVVLSLIEGRQHTSLLTILKSMPKDFLACKEPDLFAIHLETLTAILIFFDKNAHTGGFLQGLNIIANQCLRQTGSFRKMMEEKASELLDLNQLTNILTTRGPEYQPLLKSLLDDHASGLLEPLLKGLFDSADRNIRKKILEVLHRQGPLIYPSLLFKLESAIKQNAPWYVKRNLLTLLSIKPPIDLAPLLLPLYREKNQKMRELTCRCLFQLAEEKAYKLGKIILRDTDETQLGKVLDYVHVGKDPAYAEDVYGVYNRVATNRLKLAAISILGKIGSEQSVEFLGKILDNVSRFGGEKPEMRLAAARALISSKNGKALSYLLKHQRDPDKEIKAHVKNALTRIAP